MCAGVALEKGKKKKKKRLYKIPSLYRQGSRDSKSLNNLYYVTHLSTVPRGNLPSQDRENVTTYLPPNHRVLTL